MTKPNEDPAVLAVALDPKGDFCVSAFENGVIGLADIPSESTVALFKNTDVNDPVSSIAISADKKSVITAHVGGTVRIWTVPLAEGQTEGVCSDSTKTHTDRVNKVVITDDGTEIISGSNDKTVVVWSQYDQKESLVINVGFAVTALAVTQVKKEHFIAVGGENGQISFVNLRKDEFKHSLNVLNCHRKEVSTLNFSKCGKRLISGGKDKRVCVFDFAPPHSYTKPHYERFEDIFADEITEAAISNSGMIHVFLANDTTLKFQPGNNIITPRIMQPTNEKANYGPAAIVFKPKANRSVIFKPIWGEKKPDEKDLAVIATEHHEHFISDEKDEKEIEHTSKKSKTNDDDLE